jgi:hypothetical protein
VEQAQVLNRFMDLLVQAADKVGMEGARLWPQIVLVTFVTNLVGLIIVLAVEALLVVGTACLIRLSVTNIRAENRRKAEDQANGRYHSYTDYSTDGWYVLATIPTICTFVVGLFLLILIPNLVAGVIAPEAVTVLNIVKGAK